MSGLVESATAIMSMAARRLDIVSRNVANISTPGYKRQIGFADFASAGATSAVAAPPAITIRNDPEQGKLEATGNPLDVAISGDGYFKLRHGEEILYSRQGQFHRDADGALVTPQGYVLQQSGGGDLVIEEGAVSIQQDGTVLVSDRPSGKIAIEQPAAGVSLNRVGESFFSAAAGAAFDEPTGTTLRQGMAESSNVVLSDEMTASMLALRQAESGARLIQLYDDLMGRAVTTFGQGGGR